MGVSSAVQWWDQSQLQVLVLASLTVQSFLVIFGPRRVYNIPPWLRFFIWLSFLGGDAVAIYALASLFNRQKEVQAQQMAHESHDLEVFWTPILLMHLGGLTCISAYNLEDNELWRRHIITSLSQITVAIYVFWKWWPSSADKRLLGAAILIFIPGILQCMDKPFCLRESSFNNAVRTNNDPWSRQFGGTKEVKDIEEYIKEARDFIASPNPSQEHSRDMAITFWLFTDLARHYDIRLGNLKSFWTYDAPNHRHDIYRTFRNFYTKCPGLVVAKYMGDLGSVFLCYISPPLLLLVATVLFHTSNKQTYRASDIIVTLTLLYGTILVELMSSFWPDSFSSDWHDMVAQHSFTEFAAYSSKDTKLTRLALSLKCVHLLLDFWFLEPCHSSESITSTVRGYVKLWWEEFITDSEHYREVSDFRGQWTLERNGLVVQLGWSLDKQFDESVLLWHIATDLCFHSTDHTPPRPSRCKEISNYMAHLLAHKPEMLMTGSRKVLIVMAVCQYRVSLEDEDEGCWQDGRELALEITERMTIEESANENFVHDAKLLAQRLMDIGQEKMWQVIEGVWVEMLCYSAGRCPGHLHIKSLGSGGEYLTTVWLMLEHAGMESLPERIQKRSLFEHNIMQNHQSRGGLFQDATAPSSVSQDEGTIIIPIGS